MFKYSDLPKVVEAICQSFGFLVLLDEITAYLRYACDNTRSERIHTLVEDLTVALSKYRNSKPSGE